VPPCGHIAGTIARLDRQVGVHKPPANERLEGVADLSVHLSTAEQLAHDPQLIVNCLRPFPGRGIRVWGARTTSAEPDARFISVRRLLLTMSRWFELHMADVVLEPNGPPLWARVRREVNDYLYKSFSTGALRGATPPDAYFIKCDEETTPPEARERGELCVKVGIAPVVPGEFIVVRLVHTAGGVQTESAARP
jgi:phage tail sheath protein FI